MLNLCLVVVGLFPIIPSPTTHGLFGIRSSLEKPSASPPFIVPVAHLQVTTFVQFARLPATFTRYTPSRFRLRSVLPQFITPLPHLLPLPAVLLPCSTPWVQFIAWRVAVHLVLPAGYHTPFAPRLYRTTRCTLPSFTPPRFYLCPCYTTHACHRHGYTRYTTPAPAVCLVTRLPHTTCLTVYHAHAVLPLSFPPFITAFYHFVVHWFTRLPRLQHYRALPSATAVVYSTTTHHVFCLYRLHIYGLPSCAFTCDAHAAPFHPPLVVHTALLRYVLYLPPAWIYCPLHALPATTVPFGWFYVFATCLPHVGYTLPAPAFYPFPFATARMLPLVGSRLRLTAPPHAVPLPTLCGFSCMDLPRLGLTCTVACTRCRARYLTFWFGLHLRYALYRARCLPSLHCILHTFSPAPCLPAAPRFVAAYSVRIPAFAGATTMLQRRFCYHTVLLPADSYWYLAACVWTLSR